MFLLECVLFSYVGFFLFIFIQLIFLPEEGNRLLLRQSVHCVCDTGKVLANIVGITDISKVLTLECVFMNLVLCINFLNQLPFFQSLVSSLGPMHLLFVQ